MLLYPMLNLVEGCFNKLKNSSWPASGYDNSAGRIRDFADAAFIRLRPRHFASWPKNAVLAPACFGWAPDTRSSSTGLLLRPLAIGLMIRRSTVLPRWVERRSPLRLFLLDMRPWHGRPERL